MKKKILLITCLTCIYLSTNAQTILGIDVSALQGNINWTKVNLAGKTFAFAKATKGVSNGLSCSSGGTGYTDSKFFTNMSNGNNSGVKMGAYHFALPEDHSAVAEANYFLSVASPYIGVGYLPPVLDLEDPAGTCIINSQPLTNYFTSSQLTTWVQTWMTTVQNATGVTPIIYLNASLANYLNGSLNNYKLWIATPGTSATTQPTNIGNWTTWAFKQYDWFGTVAGIYPMDLDVFNGTTSAFNLLLGSCSAPTISLQPSNSTVTAPTGKSFSVTAFNGITPYSYQWQICAGGVCNWSNLSNNTTYSGVTSAILTIVSTTTTMNGYKYRCVVYSGSTCSTYSVNSNSAMLTVNATTQNYTVTTSSSPVAGGTTSGGGTFPNRQTTTIEANSNSGYSFANWIENGNPVTSNASYTFNVTANRSLVANFSPCSYTLNYSSTSVIAAASSDAFWVYSSSGCSWTATTSGCSGMITLTNASGNGNGMVTFNISQNLSALPRSCTITVQGNTFSVNQAGYVAPCGTPPANATNCSALVDGNNVISVSWWSGGWANLVEYQVDRSLSASGPFSTIAFIMDSSTNYLDSSVVAGVTYYYRVRACCNSNCSNYTNIASAQACFYSTATTSILASTTNLCVGDSVTLTVNGGILGTGASWVWRSNQCNSGTIVGTGNSITILPTNNTAYVVKAEGGCSYGFTPCSVIISTLNQLPTASTILANGNTTFCTGNSVILSGNNSGGIWSNGSSATSITVSTSGDFFVTNSNPCGSVASNHILVTVHQTPTASITQNDSASFCSGDSVTLIVNKANSYLWSNSATTQSITMNAVGNYSVLITDSNGCTANASVVVSMNTPQNHLSIIVINDTLFSPYNQPLNWFLVANSNSQGINSFFTCGAPGSYFVVGTDANGCLATSDTVTLTCSTGIESSYSISGNIHVFPNPTNDLLNIKGAKIENGEYNFLLKNIFGQTMFDDKLTVANHSLEKQFSISQLSSGIYFLIIENAKTKTVTKVHKMD